MERVGNIVVPRVEDSECGTKRKKKSITSVFFFKKVKYWYLLWQIMQGLFVELWNYLAHHCCYHSQVFSLCFFQFETLYQS